MSSDIESWPPPEEPKAFESLCLALFQEIWGSGSGAQKNGRSGQQQAGVDIYGRVDGRWVGVQCKQKSGLLHTKLNVVELEGEVRNALHFTPPLTRFIVATTAPRDAAIQTRARELTETHATTGFFTVEIWSWPEIWSEIYRRKDLLDRVGPVFWPAQFRGVATISLVNVQEEIRTGEDLATSLLIIRMNIAVLFLEPRKGKHIQLSWDPPELGKADALRGLANIIEWKKIHRLAERLTLPLFSLKIAFVSSRDLPAPRRAYEIQRVVDTTEAELRAACQELGLLSPTLLRLNGIVARLTCLRFLPGAVRQDLASSHNGDYYLLPSAKLVERALEWSLNALHVADLMIEKYLEKHAAVEIKTKKASA